MLLCFALIREDETLGRSLSWFAFIDQSEARGYTPETSGRLEAENRSLPFARGKNFMKGTLARAYLQKK